MSHPHWRSQQWECQRPTTLKCCHKQFVTPSVHRRWFITNQKCKNRSKNGSSCFWCKNPWICCFEKFTHFMKMMFLLFCNSFRISWYGISCWVLLVAFGCFSYCFVIFWLRWKIVLHVFNFVSIILHTRCQILLNNFFAIFLVVSIPYRQIPYLLPKTFHFAISCLCYCNLNKSKHIIINQTAKMEQRTCSCFSFTNQWICCFDKFMHFMKMVFSLFLTILKFHDMKFHDEWV